MPDHNRIDRRRFVGAAAMTFAAVQLGLPAGARSNTSADGSEGNSDVAQMQQDTASGASAIRPFNAPTYPKRNWRFAPAA